ncbi:MarR family winged helix-turn-helix transcriptional regulator [Mycolicibacterium lutetiense]|uniref:DNA-binding MarR family transcriptional regulator n=1 Tax=Mycolicibacterium lutetiense TaxID=1641992 RepID=A0ABS4ZPC3_9MYCO|nr:MarR family transcriptional regulator [Mycolicibacterium lutetiense]MBP2451348.1 DNA-binding MarR family transcriptional regulator [Mycolicibacterium lutetiense]
MSTPTEDVTLTDESELGADLLSVVARLNRLATQRTRLPVPWAQARLLSTIEDQGEARISDLALLDHCSQPTMTTQVRRLEDAGLVTRTTDPGDARAVLIAITEKGRQTLEQARADRAATINPRLERLTAEERRTLAHSVGIIRRMLADVDEHPLSPNPS